MLVSEEHVAALEAEVAEVLGILEMLDGDEVTEGIHRYAEQVGRIGLAAGSAGFLGLQDVCLLFQEKLADWGIHGRDLSGAERERLEEWPILAIGYLISPSDPQASEALLDHLRNPVWSTPLSEEEAGVLRDLLMPDALAAEQEESSVTPETLAATEPEPATVEPWDETVVAATEPESVKPPPVYEAVSEAITEAVEGVEPWAATEMEQPGEPVVAIATEAIPDVAASTVEAESAILAETVAGDAEAETAIAEVQTEATTETAEAETVFEEEKATIEQVVDEQEQVQEEQEVQEQEQVQVQEQEQVQEQVQVQEQEQVQAEEAEEAEVEEEQAEVEEAEVEEEEEQEEEEEEAASATASSANAKQELLEILCAEIVQLAEAADEILALVTAADSTPAARSEALSSYAENLERLGDASGSIGFTGFHQVCVCLQSNLSNLAVLDSPLNAEQRRVVETWPDLAINYLQALDDRSVCAALVNHLQDPHWPQPLAIADAAPLVDLLVAPRLVTEETEAEARPRQAQPEDVSLVLPADVNQELLDGLLQELPLQAADFSAAIQRLAAGDGNLKDVEVAQRIAHTLKGAGNTVGVRGIATLTHHMEDILQALSKHGALPNRPLAETLLTAADCLETMSEALLGMSAPPSQALAVLQEVLDWANRIDRTGIPTGDEAPPAVAARPESTEQPETAPTAAQLEAASAPEVTLRVPAHLVDDVLRLVGESIILTGQIQERIRNTIAQTRAVVGQNRLFQQLTAELEQLVDVRNVSSPLAKSMQRGDFDPLELEQYNELNTVTHRLVEAVTDTRELGRGIEDNLAALNALLVDQGRLHRDNQEAVLRTRMVPIQTVVPRLQRSVRQTCRLVDKEAELVVRGTGTLVDSNVLNDMVDPLMHILRNAVDHGIEPPDQRKRLGKHPVGRIELSFMREGNNIAIRCQDDGAGLDLAAIRRTAVERGLLASDKLLADDELARLILLPGFSTRGETTQTSGRGIGMDVVYSRLLDMKGSLRIQTKAGQGCLMELRLPVTLISTHALLLRMRNQMIALSDRGIEQILYSGVGKIQKLGKATTFQMGDDVYELTSLDTLLNLPPDHRAQGRGTPPVLLVREETGNIRAVLAQEILDSRELVVKRLGQYIPKLNGIVGATILGDGSVVPVLDLPELLRAPAVGESLMAARAAAPAAPTVQRQFVLAVDDSLSARRSLAQFAQDAGFEVRTARDGLEAIDVIKGKRPDLVLADLEMPRMNGLELTAHLRANQATRDLPIIMITSRSTEKHRREAQREGVNAYLTKPFMEENLLEQINKLLRRK